MENRNKDDIRYAEYFIRKTIQPYSLRAKRTNPSENICFRKNLTLFLNKQTAHLRDGKGKDASIRELFQNTNTESIPIFPTVIPKMEKKMVNHRSTQSLNMKDPNGWIFRKVEDYLNNQQCHDFIYAETPPSTIAVKKEEEGEKPLPPEEEIEQAILDAIKEKDMTKYFTTFYNKMQVHKLRQYRSQSDKKDSGIQTFFTDLKEDPSSPKKQKSSFFSQSNSSNFIKIKDVFEKNEKELDKAILDEICAENNLTTEKLLGIGDIVNEGKPLKSIPTEPKEEDDTDVIEMAQVETYKEKRELSRFKKKNLKPGENIYKTHFKNNQLYSNEQNAKLHSMKLEQKRMMESVEHPKKTMKKSMSTQIIRNNKLNIKDMDKIMSESTNVTLNSPNFPNFNEIMGKYSSFTTPHKDLKKSSRENSEERETNRLPLVKQRPQDKIYIEGDDSLDYNSKLHDSRDTRGDTESPFRRSAMIFSPASTRYTNSASPNKKNRGPNVADKVSGFFKTVDNFYKDTNKQSGHLKHIIKEASEQLENDCNKYTSLEEGPLGTLSPEFALYKQRRIFRRKLAENITKKIQNLHVFVNALHNKRQRDKFNHVILPKASALG